MATDTVFSVGQKVSFTAVRQSGQKIKFSSRTGTVHQLNDTTAVVKARGGALHTVSIDDLRAEGVRNALTDAVLTGLGIQGETQ